MNDAPPPSQQLACAVMTTFLLQGLEAFESCTIDDGRMRGVPLRFILLHDSMRIAQHMVLANISARLVFPNL